VHNNIMVLKSIVTRYWKIGYFTTIHKKTNIHIIFIFYYTYTLNGSNQRLVYSEV